MIRLIRFDGVEILLNEEMIQSIESTPDTIIILSSGEEIKVKNPVSDVSQKIQAAETRFSDNQNGEKKSQEE